SCAEDLPEERSIDLEKSIRTSLLLTESDVNGPLSELAPSSNQDLLTRYVEWDSRGPNPPHYPLNNFFPEPHPARGEGSQANKK
ncbi:hypothetical protein LAJ55_14650, partial [Streptococcus pneumoniae]|uniref:hypothetical protein n=1 Tax=Streptococcus pneumoniae TaxID=1313 RepID=UPI001CBA7005